MIISTRQPSLETCGWMGRPNSFTIFMYTHAVKDHTDASGMSAVPCLVNQGAPVLEIIPNRDDEASLLSKFEILIAQILVEHHLSQIPFQILLLTIYHIHIIMKEMAQKSEVVRGNIWAIFL